MSPKETKLRALAVPGSTADIKERVNMRSDSMTYPRERKMARKQIKKMMNSWQTRGLIPADDQPGPTKAHRKAVTDYENGEYLLSQPCFSHARNMDQSRTTLLGRPTVDLLGLCTKEELSGIAEHYGVRLAPGMRKQQQRLALVEALTAHEVMECSVGKPEEEEVVTCDPVSENQFLLRKMELEFKFE
ncbi:hypothetical protein NQZ68_032265 [Dissostichus eleginoides]|nr:hypothetical protein NQZ68_032265 [Dissostichus eleginoides]